MKKHMGVRRLFALGLALCLMVPIAPQTGAAQIETEELPITPYYIGTISTSASFAFLPAGGIECWGHVDCYPGYTADAVMRLQWLDVDGVWMDYKNWYDEGEVITFYETYSIPHGRRYRVKVVADIFDNSTGEVVEVVGATSASLEY